MTNQPPFDRLASVAVLIAGAGACLTLTGVPVKTAAVTPRRGCSRPELVATDAVDATFPVGAMHLYASHPPATSPDLQKGSVGAAAPARKEAAQH